MEEPPSKPLGIQATARRLLGSVLALVENRFEIFSIEFSEERLRARQAMLWFGLAFAVTLCALGLLTITLAAVAWHLAAFAGLVVLTALMLAVAGTMVWLAWKKTGDRPPPFQATLAEFRKDREWLTGKH